MAEKFDVYSMVTNKIIESLENGIIPWHKPWADVTSGAISHTNGKPYSLLNQFLLGKEGEWLTFNQIKAEGGNVIKGEKSSFVVFWKFIEKEESDENGTTTTTTFPILKYYNVFHISQCEGIKPKYGNKSANNNTPIDSAEKIVADYKEREKLAISFQESNRAFYRPSNDSITMPLLSQFENSEAFYSTLFHEMTHSTGAEKRLNREGIVKSTYFGSEDYSKEELVAELGSAFLCNQIGIDIERAFNNSVGYIQSWLKALKNDKRMIVSASSQAEKAVKYILSGEK